MSMMETWQEILKHAKNSLNHEEKKEEELALKLKYPEVLIYETERSLLETRRTISSLRGLIETATQCIGSQSNESQSEQEAIPAPRGRYKNNLSEDERERRRQRMKEMWASGKFQKKPA